MKSLRCALLLSFLLSPFSFASADVTFRLSPFSRITIPALSWADEIDSTGIQDAWVLHWVPSLHLWQARADSTAAGGSGLQWTDTVKTNPHSLATNYDLTLASGDITAVIAGAGITGGAPSGAATVNLDSANDRHITGHWTLEVPTLVTPSLGIATATSINRVILDGGGIPPGHNATLTIAGDGSLITSGAYPLTFTATGTTNATVPAGTVTLVSTADVTADTSLLVSSVTAGTGLTGGGNAGAVTLAINPTYNYLRRYTIYSDPGTTSASSIGLVAVTVTATASNNDQATRPYIKSTTSTTANNVSGVITKNFLQVQTRWNPDGTFYVLTDTCVASIVLWVGFFGAAVDTVGQPATASATFRYTTVRGDPAWMAVTTSANGGTYAATTTGVNYAINTAYIFRIAATNAGAKIEFYINGNLTNAVTGASLPTTTTALGFGVRIGAAANAAKAISWSQIAVDTSP